MRRVCPYFTKLLFFRVLCHAILPNQCLFPMESTRSGESEPEYMHVITKNTTMPVCSSPFNIVETPPRSIWTKTLNPTKKKTHTSVKSPNNSPTSLEIWAWCSWAMRSCSLQFVWHAVSAPKKADAPVRLWTPGSKKKNNERNMRCLVANGWLENQMSRSCNQNQERKSQTITMWWFQQLYAYFSRDKSLHHKFLYFSTGCVFFRILEKWKVIIKKNHSSKKSAKSHQPYKLLRTGVAFPAFLSCGKEKV